MIRSCLKYIIFLLLFTIQGEAKSINQDIEYHADKGLTHYEGKSIQSSVEVVSWLIVIGFFVNLFPFVTWVKRQKPTSEFMMYQVRGSFTYFSVLAWLDAIEKGLGKPLKKQRILLANWQVITSRKKKPFAVFKPHVEKLLYLVSFGGNRRKVSFSRMRLYPRVVYIWSLIVFFVPVNYAVSYFTLDSSSYLTGILLGFFAGIIPGLFFFVATNAICNFILQLVGNFWINKKGDAGYLHELMHQFSGVYNGHWNTLEWDDNVRTEISGLDTSEETLEYIKTKLFSGKGSKGVW